MKIWNVSLLAITFLGFTCPVNAQMGGLLNDLKALRDAAKQVTTQPNQVNQPPHQQQTSQNIQSTSDRLAVRSAAELCEAIKKSPALNRYAEAIEKSIKTYPSGSGAVANQGLDSSDGLIAKWVSKRFDETFPSRDFSEKLQRSNQLISWATQCAWQLKDERVALVFSPAKDTGFWWEVERQFKSYQSAPVNQQRTINASGEVIGGVASKPPFAPHTPQLSQQNLSRLEDSYKHCSMCEIQPRRISAVLALIFANGEKVVEQVSAEQVQALESNILQYVKNQEQEQADAQLKRQQAVEMILAGYNYYAQNFSIAKASCEREMLAVYQEVVSASSKEARTVRTTGERDELMKKATNIDILKEAAGRAVCFNKFLVDVESILYGTFLATADNDVYRSIKNSQLTGSGKASVNEGIRLEWNSWLQKRVVAGIRDQAIVAIRNSKFTSQIDTYTTIFLENPQFGCTKRQDKVICS